MYTTTFVTCFIDIVKDEENKSLKKTDERFAYFELLAASKIPLAVYITESQKPRLDALCEKYPNIRCIDVVTLEDSWFASSLASHPSLSYAQSANREKDSLAYFTLMNNKVWYLKDAAEKNPFQTEYFSWIDFSIFHILQPSSYKKIQELLHMYSTYTWNMNSILVPGCWQLPSNPASLIGKINWRFCGGFLLGSKQAIFDFFDLADENLSIFFNTYKTVVWEVNYWTYLELCCGWKPIWYSADHNETMLQIPSSFLPDSLSFLPTSVSTFVLTFSGSEREARMKERCRQLNIDVTCIPAFCKKEDWMSNGFERCASFTLGHVNMVKAVLDTKSAFGFCMEDDVYIHKDFHSRVRDLCIQMHLLDLDILLCGYLSTTSPDQYGGCTRLRPIGTWGTLYTYPDHMWGGQGYLVSRAYAAYCFEKWTWAYAHQVFMLSNLNIELTPYSSDHLITKRGKRALVYPMICVEEGYVATDHPGQVALHKGTFEAHYRASEYV